MYASIFRLDLGSDLSPRDRWKSGRALASALDGLPGFVAFIALEAEDGVLAGLCVCVDAESLEEVRETAEAWQRRRAGQTLPPPCSSIQPLIAGEVIVQRGF